MSESELHEIQSIIELGKIIELWDLEIPDRIIPPGERDISRNEIFKVTGTQKEFLDLFKKARTIAKERKPSETRRIRETMTILDIFAEYGVEINNEIIGRNEVLGNVLKEIPKDVNKYIIDEIEQLGINNDFQIGEEYNFVKEKFYNRKKIFEEYELGTLKKCGIFESFRDKEDNYKKVDINYSNFIEKNCPSKFRGINLETGTLYDKNGYDIKFFNREGIHRVTNTLYDRDGFNREGYDIEGYDRKDYDKDGWNRKGWNKEKINKVTRNIL